MDLRAAAREIFFEALRAVDLKVVLRQKLQTTDGRLTIGSASFAHGEFDKVFIVAIGKAALPMTEVLLEKLDPLLGPAHVVQGIVVGTALSVRSDPRLTYRLGSHPLPDRSALETAQDVLNLLHAATDRTLVFFLLSGGASAMVELPFADLIGLRDLVSFYQALVLSGLSIRAMNTLRKHISGVKGGRLALAAAKAMQCTILVSDVPPGQDDVIGSGPSMPDPTTLDDCRKVLGAGPLDSSLPSIVRDLLTSGKLPETPKPGHPAFLRASFHTVLSSRDLCETARTAAEARGFTTSIELTCDEWACDAAADFLLNRLSSFPLGQPVCLISAGELSVPISGTRGSGGRNQHFALECARRLDDAFPASAVLSAGSDGADGNSPAAGAVVDQTTWRRAAELGFNGDEALRSHDAFPLFKAIGDTIITGPTGNNLRDLRLLLRYPGL